MLDFDFAGVDDEADAWDGDGGFGDVGCEDDFAGFGGGRAENELLGVLGKGGEEGEGEDLLVFSMGIDIKDLILEKHTFGTSLSMPRAYSLTRRSRASTVS